MYKTLGFKWLCEVFCPALAFVTADRDEARNPQRFIHVTVVCHAEKADRTNSTLVFADTKANAEKPEELFFCQRSTEKYRN